MAIDLSQRTELLIPTRTRAAIVFERRADQAMPLPVVVHGSLVRARAWIEAHYTGVRWDSERSGTALVGRRAAPIDPAACRVSTRGPRIAYQTEDFREYVPEIVADDRGMVVLVRCEELDIESGRWEPFTSIVWSHR
jgi:hypothetical protein